MLATLVIVGVFVVGAIAGAATATVVISRRLTSLFAGPPRETMARLYGALLEKRVHVSTAQRLEIEAIVNADQPGVAAQMQRIEPELSQLRRARHARIMAVLTPEQRRVAEELEREFARRHREEIGLPADGP